MDTPEKPAMPETAVATIESIAGLRRRSAEALTPHQRVLESLISACGRPATFYFLVLFALLWIVVNGGAAALGRRPIDAPPFFALDTMLSLFAVCISTLVLITENRITRDARLREDLDLQINLLAEQKITKVIALLEELRVDMPGVVNRHDPEAEQMKSAIDPHTVVSKLEETPAFPDEV